MLQSVRSKLLAGIIVPLVIFYGIVAFTEVRQQVRLAVEDTEKLLQESAKRHTERIEDEFIRISANLKLLKSYIEERPEITTDELDSMFTLCVNNNPQLRGILIAYDPLHSSERKDKLLYVYREEETVKSHLMNEEYDYHGDAYMIPAITGKEFWTEPYIKMEPTKQLICTFSVPFFYNDKFAGCLIANISLAKIREFVQSNMLENAQFAVISPTGSIISDNDPELEMNETVFSLAEWYGRKELAQWGHELPNSSSTAVRFSPAKNSLPEKMIWNNKQPVWVIPVHIKETNWMLVVAANENTILQPSYEQLQQQIILFIAGLIIIICFICFVSFRLTNELKYLTDFASELAKGNLDAKVKNKRSNDEFGNLADTFDKMSIELKSNIHRLVQETAARKIIEEEMQAARRIQTSLLPRTFPPFPNRKEFDLYAKNEPAAFIAGDFYDFFFVNDNVIAFVIADVSGHGIPAALFMAVSRTAIRNFAAKNNSAKEIINSVDSFLSGNNDDCMFVSVFFGLYDVSTGELRYVNAGHNPPYVLRSDGSYTTLPNTGTIMAVINYAQYEEKSVILQPNDVIITFTDGVTEAHRKNFNTNWHKGEDVLFSEPRLEALIQKIYTGSAEEICNTIFSAVEEHDGGEHQDDITVLVLKRIQ